MVTRRRVDSVFSLSIALFSMILFSVTEMDVFLAFWNDFCGLSWLEVHSLLLIFNDGRKCWIIELIFSFSFLCSRSANLE